MNKPMTVAILLQMADLATTLLITQAGGFELNPIVRGLLEQGLWGFVAFLVLKASMIAVLASMYELPEYRPVVWMRRFAVGYVLFVGVLALVWNLGQLL